MRRESLVTLASTIAVSLMLLTLLQPVMATRNPVPTSPDPWKKWVRNYTYTLSECPYGRLNIIVTIYKLADDGVSNYDWYYYDLQLQSVPGIVSCNTLWRTEETWAWHFINPQWSYSGDPYNPIRRNEWPESYGPTTTSGQTTISFSVSASSSPGFSCGYSYSGSDVTVYDTSDYSEYRIEWTHGMTFTGNPAKYTYLATPAFSVRTTQDWPARVQGQYSITFWYRISIGLVFFYYYHTLGPTPILYLDAPENGDC